MGSFAAHPYTHCSVGDISLYSVNKIWDVSCEQIVFLFVNSKNTTIYLVDNSNITIFVVLFNNVLEFYESR